MKDKPIKSIKHKTILTFGIFSIFLIAFMWLFQAIYFSTMFESVKSTEIEYLGTTVSTIYKTDPNFQASLLELSHQRDAGIIIFVMENETPNIIFNSSREYEARGLDEKIETFLFHMADTNSTSYKVKVGNNLKVINCGLSEYIDGRLVYFYVTAPIVPVRATTQNFSYLLLFISIGVFSATLIGSYTISAQMSLPIIRMANKAKLLTKTNINVKFNSDEYEEVKQLSDTLNYAIGELQKTDNLRKEVLANVSHELRTPLTMIKSYTELIRDISGENPEKRKQHLDVIYSEAEKLEYLINDIVDYSKLESGVMTYDKKAFNLSETLYKIKTSFAQKFSEFKITLSTIKEVYIFADPKRIEQVIVNLLNNAINYSTNKKIINIRLKPLDDDNFKLEVIDHGIGISKENIEHIFERHFRTTTAKRTAVGSGIGLSIVKSILDAHDYEIGVVSEENKGSNFFIILKRHKV